jgi:hypothetical protein
MIVFPEFWKCIGIIAHVTMLADCRKAHSKAHKEVCLSVVCKHCYMSNNANTFPKLREHNHM